MRGGTHVLIGLGVTAVALTPPDLWSTTPDPATWGAGMVVGGMASLLPDIDSLDATIRQMWGVGDKQTSRRLQRTLSRRFSLLDLLFVLLRWGMARLLNLIPVLIQHRGLTHWGLTWLVLSLLVWLVAPVPITVAFTVGYLSHILADMMTISGVAMLWPVVKRPLHLLPNGWRFRTGSPAEDLLFVLLLAVTLFLPFLLHASSLGGKS